MSVLRDVVALKGSLIAMFLFFFMSYVIDTAHLQYRLSTQEGDIAQKWVCNSSLKGKMIVDLKMLKLQKSVLKLFSI